MSESKHVSPYNALIPAAPRRIRDWMPYLSELSKDPRYSAEAVSIVEEKSGHKRKSLLRELELYTPVSLRGNLRRVLALESERMAVAMCELNSLADMPLSFGGCESNHRTECSARVSNQALKCEFLVRR